MRASRLGAEVSVVRARVVFRGCVRGSFQKLGAVVFTRVRVRKQELK